MAKTSKTAKVAEIQDGQLDQTSREISMAIGGLETLRTLLPNLTPDNLGRAYTECKRLDNALTHRRDGLLEDIRTRLLNLTLKKGDDEGVVLTSHFRVTRTETSRKTIRKEKLLEVGVTPAQIERATVVTESVYPRVTRRNGR